MMLVTLDKLELDEAVSGPLRQALEAHRLRTAGAAREQAAAEAVEILSEARARIVDWPLDDDSFDALEPGLRRMYRSGRRDWRAMRKEPERRGPARVAQAQQGALVRPRAAALASGSR